MRFVQYKVDNVVKLGVVSQDGSIIKDITSLYPNCMKKFIEADHDMEDFKNKIAAMKTTIPAAKVEVKF